MECVSCNQVKPGAYRKKMCNQCYNKDYRSKNRDKLNKKDRKYYSENSERLKQYQKDRRFNPETREKVLASQKAKYYERGGKEKQKIWVKNNEDKIKATKKKSQAQPHCKSARNEKRRNRRRDNPNYRLYCNLRKRVSKVIKGESKAFRSLELLGCSVEEYRKWIEWQFMDKMSWENHGKFWHVDHVTPCASFNIQDPEEQLKCFNWKNCHPMKASDNLRKKDKILPRKIMFQELRVKYYEKNK